MHEWEDPEWLAQASIAIDRYRDTVVDVIKGVNDHREQLAEAWATIDDYQSAVSGTKADAEMKAALDEVGAARDQLTMVLVALMRTSQELKDVIADLDDAVGDSALDTEDSEHWAGCR